MLHARYKHIQTCPLEKKDIISQEITPLHSVNSKSKSYIPEHLQYRDRGYMYFPTESFLPFLRVVDTCVRKYANPTCYGSQIQWNLSIMGLRIKDTSVIRTPIDGPKQSAIETCTYLISELRTPLFSVIRMHDAAPNGHIAWITTSFIRSRPRP